MTAPLKIVPQAFQIEVGVPLPPSRRGKHGHGRVGPIVRVLRQLITAPVGASVLIQGKSNKQIGSYIKATDQTVIGWASVRNVDGGVRVWKIAEPKARV